MAAGGADNRAAVALHISQLRWVSSEAQGSEAAMPLFYLSPLSRLYYSVWLALSVKVI